MTYKVQIDDEVRDATPEEAARIEAQAAQAAADAQAIADRAAAVASARAKLAKLGLTDDEINAFLA